MRLVTFSTPGESPRPGNLTQDGVVDLGVTFNSVDALIEAGPEGLDRARAAEGEVLPLNQVTLHPPLQPASLRDFIAFRDHAAAGARRRGEDLNPAWGERPWYYKGNHRSIIGPDEDMRRPSFTQELDFEMEIACVVGRRVRNPTADEAAEAILGFTVMNDWSARDVQRAEMASRLGPAKSKDFATSLGPWLLTGDQVGAAPDLAMTARVNGHTVCEARLGAAQWTFPEMIAFVARDEDVMPGDVYGSGTPFGGCMLDHGGPYLEPGDVVEIEIEKLGILRNRVVAPD